MPHQIANNSASVVVTLIALCMVLTTGLLKEWMWEIDVAMWFLMLASDTMIVEIRLDDALSASFSICFLTQDK